MNRLFATLGVLVLTGCLVPSGPDRGGGGPTAEPGKGQLEVRWTGEREARGILGSLWASSTADVYELVLVGSSGNRAVDLSLGSGQVVSLDPGTYRVMVLAGVKRSSGSTYAYLVGSALAEAVTVHDGQRSAVDLTLKSIDLGLAAKSPAYWKGTVTMTTAGKSRNPRLGMLLAGTSTTARPRFKSVELWNGYREMTSVTGTPDDWTAEATGTVPDGAAAFTVALVGAGLCLQGVDDQWVATTGITKLSWAWPSRPDLADTHPLVPWTEVQVNAGPPPTGLTVGLGWE